MIIANISMNPEEYGNTITYSQAAKMARAMNAAVQKQFSDVFTVYKMELSSVISSDGKDEPGMIKEVKNWIDNLRPHIVEICVPKISA